MSQHYGFNAIYVASNNFMDTNLSGYGTFDYSKKLVLTKEGFFQSASRGQEFVVECDKDILKWVKKLIWTCSGH